MPVKTSGTVTLKDIAARIAEDNELSKRAAEDILTVLVGNIVGHLKKGQRVRLGGLGTLQVRNRAARTGRNPGTGAIIQIDASKNVVFLANSKLRALIGSLPGDEGTDPPRPDDWRIVPLSQEAEIGSLPGDEGTDPPRPDAGISSLPGGEGTDPAVPDVNSSSTKKSGA
jgi:DNA-binding protein HU-beta